MNSRYQGVPRDLARQLTKLRQSLRKVEADVGRTVAPAAVRAAAAVLHAAVARECPVDSGFLRSKVKIVGGPAESGSFTLFVQVGDEDFAGKVFYAAMVEYGTSEMAADPFMRRAIEKDGRKAVDAARRVVDAAVKGGFVK